MLSSKEIRKLIEKGAITVDPFGEELIASNGLELRLGGEACRLLDREDIILDPEEGVQRAEDFYECIQDNVIVFKPNSKYLIRSFETISFSSRVAAIITIRSTWARTGFMIPPTIVDAGYRGQLTVLVSTPTFPVRLKEGIRFFHLAVYGLREKADPYAGSYQNLKGISLPKFFYKKTGEEKDLKRLLEIVLKNEPEAGKKLR